MTITRTLYDTATLLAVTRQQDAPSNYWLNLLFGRTINFDDEYIDFERIPSNGRKLAPLVTPLSQGRPIYQDSSTVARVKPAYVKPKDPVTPTRVMSRRPGELLSPVTQNPSSRRNAIIADILASHRDAIERRCEWMAAQAVLYASVTLADDDYPTRIVDFGRNAGNTIVLGSGSRWGDNGISILDNIQTWMDLMSNSVSTPFGGAPDRITVGTGAWAIMRKDAAIIAEMSTQRRGNTDLTIATGLIKSGFARYVGTLGAGLEVWVYNDFYTVAGSVTPFMDTRDIVLTSSAVDGVQCFGAIQDAHAGYQPLSIYSRNWIDNDPPVEFVMSQSAPLMVPVNPNASLRARVIA